MNIVIAILIFSLIVLFHELGHFLLAKKNGIRVNEFCLGLGPTLVGVTKGETKYSIKALPFGGACVMEGEDDGSHDERAFNNQSVLSRISVIVAGPVFNFIMAFLFSMALVAGRGYDKPVLSSVMNGFPAQEAGIEAGDTILSMNGAPIRLYREVTLFTYFHPGEQIQIVFDRDGQRHEATVTPRYVEEDGRYYIGFVGGEMVKANPLQVPVYGLYEVWYWIDLTLQSIKMLALGQVGLNDLSGPVGMVQVIGDTYEESAAIGPFQVFLSMSTMVIFLSANLGVMNLLPLPALDGGRLLFLIIEGVRGRRIDPNKEGIVHFVGFILLMALMVFVMYNDIRKLLPF